MIARKIIYTGRVQGVGFRYSVQQLAAGFDVLGYVKNLPDGTVELLLQGEAGEVEAMQAAILQSHLKGHIRKFDVADLKSDPALTGFRIRH